MIFEPLVQYDHGGVLVPALAESWSFSEDERIITFNLRHGVTFHDGAPWNAEAMKWNFDRWIGTDDHNWLLTSINFAETVIVDPMTVELHLTAPVPHVLFELSIVRPVRFLSPTSVAADGTYQSPVGTGPWVLTQSDSAQTMLVRNEDYWGEMPAVSSVELITIQDGRSRVAALRAGDVDVIGGDFVAPISPVEARTLARNDIAVETATGTTTFLLAFNFERASLRDPRVREAISISIDREAVAAVLYSGFATPAGSLYPETIPNAGARRAAPARDIERAAALLEAAGWTGEGVRQRDGVPLNLELVASEEAAPGSRALAEVVQQQLGDIGVDVTIRSVDHATRHDDIPAGNYDLAFFFTIGAPYDPHSTFTNYFLSTVDNGADGKMFEDAEHLDPLILSAVQAGDDSQAEHYQALYDWIHDNHAVAPLVYTPRIWAYADHVQGFEIPPTEFDMPFRGISLQF